MRQSLVLTVLFMCSVCISACGKNASAPPAAPSVSLDNMLAPVRPRLSFEQAAFFGNLAWATDYSGVLFVTKDEGRNWERVAIPEDGRISAMQFEDGGRLGFVVARSGKLMRTDDAGLSWTTIDLVSLVRDSVDLDFGGYFDQIEFDTSLENGVWIDYCQIFQTSDSGKSWSRLADGLQDKGSEERCVADAVYMPASNSWFASVEIVGRMLTSGDYLYRSDNGGSTWQEVCSLDEVGMLLKSIPSCFNLDSNDADLNAAVEKFSQDFWSGETEEQEAFEEQIERGIFVSKSLSIPDDSNGWRERAGLIDDPTNDRTWLSFGEHLAYTDNDGESWQVVSDTLPDNELLDFSLGVERGFAILHYEYMAMSEDVGRTWTVLSDTPRSIYNFRVLPEHDRIVAATETGLAVLSTETLEWRDVPQISESAELVVVGPVVWAFASDGKVHRSNDAGVNWTTLADNLEQHEFYVESASCTASECLLEGYQSLAHLTAEPFGFEVMDLTGLLPDPDENYIVETILDAERGRAWIAMEDGRVHTSNDGGRTWQALADMGEEISEFRPAPGNSNFLAWGYTSRYLWSGDGEAFETLRFPVDKDTSVDGLCWLDDSTALFVAYDYKEEEALYFASLDGGATWGPTEPISFNEPCRVGGGLIVFDSMIAKTK